ncbi:MAG: outer membrane protein transport protein [Thiomicrorhabdus chilensis]|uniref:OmpP1/FadL family transporter n=1 Tax=Thiomicrorhabdus chilensis TaxID=63656 RepID=UPI00299E2A32|nr:outer membrane protein transport protein [Thiomicrorhabdus chilensis]MDX1347235.1 outer membrane protein transport protein [Thiomicrorhabdus chilensis]
MRKTKLALAIATSAMISTPVLATNGDNLIGLGAQARALGGTGTAAFFGSENALTNPALLGKSQGTEFAIGGTLFKPDVKATTDVATSGQPADSQTSDADTNIIPEVSLSTRINDNWTFGLGIFGSAGMGTDYRDTDALFNGYSNLQIMKFAPSLAYNEENFGFGFAPVIQYGALDINYKMDADFDGTNETNVGNGMSSDLGYGFNLGAYFDVTKEFTIAAAYQSAISMEYDDQMSVASGPFANFGFLPAAFDDKLEQPAEIKIGAAYTTGNWMLTADAKQIKWGDAEGYKDFGWEDQNVFGLGAKYSGNDYWVGVGYNFGSDPIDETNNQTVNMFNNHFFPAVVERHFTFGGGYNITKNMAIDAAVVYAAEVEKTVDTSQISSGFATAYSMSQGGGAVSLPSEHEVTHSQIGYTVSLRMNF